MMEQAINTFEEGLIMDLNPLTTPANVLTSCLNGTLITYNGNEFVLQNDDGNGRVETAYLPSGYVPVGIKEYGGIIYVTSYNPLTNKGQIGSFPSPERNISSEEIGAPKQGLTPDNFKFKYKLDDSGNKLTNKDGDFISDEGIETAYAKLELLKEDTILRPGDKFAIQFNCTLDNLGNLSEWLEDYDNTSGESNNRLLKIRISIADSNGNLIDITESLKRVKDNQIIWPRYKKETETDEKWLADKYNNYFMQYTENTDFTPPTLEDARRVDKFLNVYNNKVAGTLYLTAELATIDSYELGVSGVKTEYTAIEGGKEVIKKGALIEFITSYTSEILDTYKESAPEDGNPKDYWYGNKIDLYLESKDAKPSNVLSKNPNTGEFIDSPLTVNIAGKIPDYTGPRTIGKQEISLDLPQEDVNASTGLLTYTVLPNMIYGRLKTYERSGFLDINLLGTGKVNLNLWQYYTDLKQGKTTIRFGFQAYPEEKEPITAVKFTFYNIKDYKPGELTKGLTKQLLQRANWHGSSDETFQHTEELEAMTLYIVGIEVYSNEGLKSDWSTFRYLYTTELYNEYYLGKKVENGIWYDFDSFNPTPLIQLNSGLNITNDNYTKREPIETIEKTSVIGKNSDPLKYNYTRTWKYLWDYDPKSSILYKSKYPFELNTPNLIITPIISKSGIVDEDSKVPVGNPTTLPGDIEFADVVEGKLEIRVPTINNLTGLADSPKVFKGSVLQSYMDESNISNALAWDSTANKYKLDTFISASTATGEKQHINLITKWYINGKMQGEVTVKTRTTSTENRKTFVGWKNEGKGEGDAEKGALNFLDSVSSIPREILVGDIIILDIIFTQQFEGDTQVKNITTAILFKDSIGDYILLDAKGSKLGTNGYNILKNLFGHMLVASDSNKVSTVNAMSNPNYWKDYIYNWIVSIATNNTLKADLEREDSLFILDTGVSFGKETTEKWVNSLELPEELKTSKERESLKTKPCISFDIIPETSATPINRKEQCPNIDSIVTSYLNPQLDGMVVAIGLNGELYTETYNGAQFFPNKLYTLISGAVYDTLDNYNFTDKLDIIRMQLAKSLKFNLANPSKLVMNNPTNTYTGDFPRCTAYQNRNMYNFEAIWSFIKNTQNIKNFSNIPIYKLDSDNLDRLSII